MTLRARLLAPLVAMSPKVTGNLHHNQRRYKKCFEWKIWAMPELSVGQWIYVDRPPLITLSSKSKADSYNKILSQLYASFSILNVTKRTLPVEENSIPNIIYIDPASPVPCTVKYLRPVDASKNLLEDKKTLEETRLLPSFLWESSPLPLRAPISPPLVAEKTSLEYTDSNLKTTVLLPKLKMIKASAEDQIDSLAKTN